MYSERAHSGLDVMREIGMSSLNKLAQAVIDTHDQNRVDRETIHAEDVIRGRAIWRLTTAGWHSGFDFDIMVRPRQRRYPVGSGQEVFWHELPKRFQACVVMHGSPVRDERAAGQHKRNRVYGSHCKLL